MSDNNTPALAVTTLVPVTVTTKAPKSKGPSIYNRVVSVLLLTLVIATTALLTSTVQETKAQKDMQDETQTFTEQEDTLAAPAWCVQVILDSTDKVDELYFTYDRMPLAAQETAKKECKDRADAIQLLKFNDTENAFTVDSTCELDDAQMTLHRSVDVSPASDTMKTKPEALQTIDLTLKVWSDRPQLALGTPDHVIDSVVTVTMTKDEKASVDFTFPFDTSWGSHYEIEIAKYFPNM